MSALYGTDNLFVFHVSSSLLWKLIWLLNTTIDYWKIIQISPICAARDTEKKKKKR